ncbi:MAG: sulfotransferase [Leptolyngbyaceae cyanobacterium MO_188.B28]|nr:sulfotransferase [Leptolyngbyaceae cyanobacterium MO_188.B28]
MASTKIMPANHLKSKAKKLIEPARSLSRRILFEYEETISTRKVSFVIAGAQKSGTTALDFFLRQHPEICMPTKKETNFFAYNFNKGTTFYHSLFPFPTRGKILGEASPSYMLCHSEAAPRIADYNPQMKLIFILKNPIDRAYSQYKMHRSKHDLRLSFEECLEIAKQKGEKKVLNEKSGFSTKTIEQYLEFGRYPEQIKTFKRFFPASQMLFLRTEDLMNKHNDVMKAIYAFLGVNGNPTQSKVIHSYQGDNISVEARKILLNEYLCDIEELERMLGWDLSEWKNFL